MVAPRRPRKKVQCNTRLYEADVAELKRRAYQLGMPWQTMLRNLVHDVLSKKETIR